MLQTSFIAKPVSHNFAQDPLILLCIAMAAKRSAVFAAFLFGLLILSSAAAVNAVQHLGNAPVGEQWDGVSVKPYGGVHPAASGNIGTEGVELEESVRINEDCPGCWGAREDCRIQYTTCMSYNRNVGGREYCCTARQTCRLSTGTCEGVGSESNDSCDLRRDECADWTYELSRYLCKEQDLNDDGRCLDWEIFCQEIEIW